MTATTRVSAFGALMAELVEAEREVVAAKAVSKAASAKSERAWNESGGAALALMEAEKRLADTHAALATVIERDHIRDEAVAAARSYATDLLVGRSGSGGGRG